MQRYDQISPFDSNTGLANAVIETPRGSTYKYRFEPDQDCFYLDKALPAGAVFPFDFGFVPSTRAEDGDPLDVLVLMDEPAYGGCLVPCRLLGVIEAEQTEAGKTVRNDRLVAVTTHSHRHRDVRSLDQLAPAFLDEIEHFFASYNALFGKRFKPRGRHGPGRAKELVAEAAERLRASLGGPKKEKKSAKARQG